MVLCFERVRAGTDSLLVPPFECAWLSDLKLLDDAHYHFPPNNGCVEFAVRGTNDATLLLTPRKGSNRLETGGSYCVIFGSNRNQCLRIERNGEYRTSVTAPWTKLNPCEYNRYWVSYQGGTFHVGVGEYRRDSCLFSWTDTEEAIEGVSHVALSSWDTHLSYKEIRVRTECVCDDDKGMMGMGSGKMDMFKPSLFDSCLKALGDGLTEERALRVLLVLADKAIPGAEPLWRKLIVCVARGFEEVATCHVDLFSLLPFNLVTMVLASPELSAHWDEILEAVAYWSFYGQEPSMTADLRIEADIVMVLKLIRFHFIDDKVLENILESPLARRVNGFHLMVKEGKCIKGNMLTGMYCGDHYGACHNLGTRFGKHPWLNPVMLKEITVRTSSPPGRCTIPKEVVGNRFLSSSYSGPRYENGNPQSWWSVDFGDRKLICTHYSLRHDASDALIRTWNLQGSNNGVEWIDLRRHISDFTIKSKGEWGAWPVHTDRSYHIFRLLQTGPNASITNPDHLCLSSIEFYGILLEKVSV